MDKLKDLSKKKFLRKEKRNTLISEKLNNEIKATQKLLSGLYKQKYKRKKAFTRIQASDFIAETFRQQRYKLKNG
jgi:CRISPR/Cas system-associated protein Cas5 (RAMP superfamily)